MISKICHCVVVCLIGVLALLHFKWGMRGSAEDAEFPQRPIKVIVPFKAGGGTDLFARLVQRAVAEEDLLGQPLVVVNQGGASGTIGSRSIKQAKPDGYEILCLHDGIMTSRFAGMVNYGPEAFDPIAQTGDVLLLVVVHQDAPYRDLVDLMQKVEASPDEISFGTNIGAPAHFAGRLLEHARTGARFNYVQSGGGANRYTLLIGGHIDVGVFSLAEFIAFRADEKIRALGVLAAERHALLPEVPTAREQGVNVVTGNALYWWAPKGTPEHRTRRIADALSKAMQSHYVQSHSIDPVFRSGSELQTYLAQRANDLARVGMSEANELPDFPKWIMVATAILFALTLWSKCHSKDLGAGKTDWQVPSRKPMACFVVACFYVLTLQFTAVGYVIATALTVLLMGGIICDWKRSRIATLLEIALLCGLGTQVIFSQLLSVMLP